MVVLENVKKIPGEELIMIWTKLFKRLTALRYPLLSRQNQSAILKRYSGGFIPDLGYATVKDFCDSADFFPQIVRFESSLKDVQRPWAIKTILATMPIGSKILEIGGGEPLVSGFLQNLGYKVTLIDPYDGSGNGPKEYGRFKRIYPQIRILRDYFKEDCSALANDNFDCIFSVSVLEHIPTQGLRDIFGGIGKFLKPGGRSIHCIDDVVDGPTSDWHFQEVMEVLALQLQLQDPRLALSDARSSAEDKLRQLYDQLNKDIETYYLSPLEHYRWKNGVSYEEYPFRKIISIQTCITKQ